MKPVAAKHMKSHVFLEILIKAIRKTYTTPPWLLSKTKVESIFENNKNMIRESELKH